MTRERVALQPAYLLHQHAWRETSRILEIFSRDHGRLGLVARGARRPGSPLHGVLQPFQPLLISWVSGGELGTLSGAESAEAPMPPLRGPALLSAFYLNELLLRLLPRQDPQAPLYAQYIQALARLPADPAPALRVFEKHLLAALGYGLNLTHAADDGAPLQAALRYRYDPERGPLPAGVGEMQSSVSGATLLALAGERFEDRETLREARDLLRTIIERQLAGRPLRTRELLSTLGRAAV